MDLSTAVSVSIVLAAVLLIVLLTLWIISIQLFFRYPLHATLRITISSLGLVLVHLVIPHFTIQAQIESAVELGFIRLRTAEPVLLSNAVSQDLWIPSILMFILAVIALLRVPAWN